MILHTRSRSQAIKTWAPAPAKSARSTGSGSATLAFTTSLLTLWAPCPLPTVLPTILLLWTEARVGRRLYCFRLLQQWPAPRFSCCDESSVFGLPSIVTSDRRGCQFTSALWSELCQLLHIHQSFTPTFHPQANGAVGRLHRRLKDALLARSADWYLHLPLILLNIRAAVKEPATVLPAKLLYGSQLVLPCQLVAAGDVIPLKTLVLCC
jgi:hypothetical protein